MEANDGLRSIIGNLGELGRDKSAGTYYGIPFIPDTQLINAYRTSWLARKIVDIPAKDSVRAGVDWMAEDDQIELIEAEQNRLGLMQKLYRARVLGRLLGGGALFIGTDQDSATPLDLKRIGRGGLKYLVVHSRMSLSVEEIEQDPLSEHYGRPKMYTARPVGGMPVRVHPSRLVMFYGAALPEDTPILPGFNGAAWGWSDSALLPVWSAMMNADVAPQLVTSLLHEANVDHFGIPEFIANLVMPEYEERLLRRFSLVAANKGINGTVLHDKDEIFERSSVSFASIPDVLDKLMILISGASDIPSTRLFGQSPAGMSATGESDMRNYYDRLQSDQALEMTPAVYNLMECLIRSAIGSRPDDVWFKWTPLWQLSAVELSEIGKRNAETAQILNNTGLISPPALAAVVTTQMVETGYYPGLEAATEDDPVDFEAEAAAEEERQAAELAARAAGRPAVTDATKPRTLYMRRMVKNGAAIVAWARAAGFVSPMPAEALHVTIVFSKTPLDWMNVGPSWEGELKIAAGGPRVLERFGDGGAVVLAFASHELKWRHDAAIEAGASTDFPDYQPHITISWLDPGLQIETIEPYQGEIILGPELFSEIDQEWKAKVT